AAISLGKIGDKSAIPYLEAALPKMSTRGKAAIHVALLMLEHEPERQVSTIIGILQDKKVRESNDCDFVLGYIRDLGPKGKVFLPTVRDMINLDEHAVRATLARLDDEPDKHVNWLIKELDGSNAANAAYALGQIGPKAAPAIPKIIELMKKDASTTGNVQFTVTLPYIGAPAAKPLGELLKDNNPNIRFHASIALQALGADAKDALPLILDAREKESDKRVKQELDASIQNIESENE
ncbi:MAG: HEAT repeat domain-containing protein, partial [Thermoguttaceae bacterium]